MKKPLHLLLTLLLALSLALSAPALAGDDDDEGRSKKNTDAQAIAEKDGSSVFDFAFDIKRVTDGVVDNQNIAVAYASCESCRAVAISIQIVLVAGGVDVLTPQNLAVAVNEECVSCTSLAYAYQFVFGGGEELTFTRRGRRELMRIRRMFKRLAKDESLSEEEFNARAKELTDELRTVLRTELVPKRDDDDDDDDEDDDDERGGEDLDEDERSAGEDRRDGTGTTPTEPQPTETQPTETQPTDTEPTGTQPTETEPADPPSTTETTPAP